MRGPFVLLWHLVSSNSFFATTTKLNGALITVGTYSLVMGIAKLLLGDEAQVNSTFRIQWADQFIWACFLFSLAVCVVAAYILDHGGSRPGIQPHSLRQRALYIGLPFIVTGVCAGLAGMLKAERVNAVWTTTVEMPVAVVLAVLLAGGSPFIWGRTGSRILYIFGALLASLTVELVYYLTMSLSPTSSSPILLVTGLAFIFALLLHVFASYGDLVYAHSDDETGAGQIDPSVSSTAPSGVALWGQGASRAEEAGQTSSQTWEYREIALGKGRDLGYVSIERQTIAAALLDFWFTWESDLRNEVSQHTTQGWETDPTAWGPSCIKYRIRSVGMSKWGCGAWLFYIVGGIATMGIGFVLGPLLMRSRALQPTEVVIRLRRLTAGGTRAN